MATREAAGTALRKLDATHEIECGVDGRDGVRSRQPIEELQAPEG
jgi:hypothetical protein